MNLTQKEMSLIKDMKSQEQLCVDKYNKYASEACDPQLKNLLGLIAQAEQNHVNTLSQMEKGTVPDMQAGTCPTLPTAFSASTCPADGKNNDKYICSDLLSTEKHVSAVYNTSIFEFADVGARNALNHIQKEEQEHGEKLFAYMNANGMYNV